MYLFDYNYKLLDFKDILKIKKILNLKDLYILDYGCGKGIWEKNQLKKIKKLILYDVNAELMPILFKKYRYNKNVNISSIFSEKLYDKPLVDGKLNTKVLKDYSSDLDIMPYSINFIEL